MSEGRGGGQEPTSPLDRLTSAAADRNKQPIATVLERVLPAAGTVLEIASGTGQHVVHFAKALRGLTWQPSDPNARARRSIRAWRATEGVANVLDPLELDVHSERWPISACDAIVCINMIHISPWSATAALFAGADKLLCPGSVLYLYGPYRTHGAHVAPSNEAFDRSLRAQDTEWGVRDLEAVADAGNQHGFELQETVAMPANNLSVIFRKA